MKKNNIRVSVIIPIYKNLRFAKEAISSVYKQNFNAEQIEIIVIEDKEGKVIRSQVRKIFPKVKIYINKDKEGPGGKRNTGLKCARGEYIVFLDSDDQLKPEFLNSMIDNIHRDPNAFAAHCLSDKLFDEGFGLIERIKRYPHIFMQLFGLLFHYYFNNGYVYKNSFFLCQISHMVFKRKALSNFAFSYDYRRGGEDWDLFVFIMRKGKIKIVPHHLIKFRFSPNSSTFTKENMLLKWNSYSLLLSRLPSEFKKGIFYHIFLLYVRLFS